MKRALMKCSFFSFLLLGLAFGAQAQTSAPAEPTATPASDTAQPVPKDAVVMDEAAKNDVNDRNCLKQTGSRLAPRPDSKGRKCVNATGRSYPKADLDSTGAIDLKDALRRLDPAVR